LAVTSVDPEQARGGAPGPLGQAPFELLDLFLAVMPDAAVVVDGDGRIRAVNQHTEKLFGYPAEKLLGQPIEALIPERVRYQHRRHRAAYAEAPRARAMGAGLDLAGRRRNGSEFPIDISLAPISGADNPLVVASIRDATERKAATSAQAELAAIVQSSLDAIVAMSLEGVITSWNPGAQRLLGYEPGAIVGRHVSALLAEDASIAFEELLGQVMEEIPTAPRDTQWRTRAGDAIDVAVSISPLHGPAGIGIVGFSAVVRDVTERRRASAELERRERTQAATAEIRLALLGNTPLDASLDLIALRTAAVVDADAAAVLLPDAGALRVAAATGQAVAMFGEALDPAPLSVGQVLASGKTVVAGSGEEGALNAALAEKPAAMATVVAPILSERGTAGVLVVARSREPDWLTDEVAAVESLAGQAALAIELANARADREGLLLSNDRERIARDLHDVVIQRLYGTGMGLQGVLRLIDDERAAERVTRAVDDLDTTIREIRTTIFALENPVATAVGLRGEVLRVVAAATDSLHFEPSVRFDGPVDSGVSATLQSHAVAVVREALSNVARHARATRADVEITVGDALAIVIADNGIGMAQPERTSGLANLRGRAETLGGEFRLSAPEDGGTKLEWRVPLS
jgi:PAS domain S-box-containing protein